MNASTYSISELKLQLSETQRLLNEETLKRIEIELTLTKKNIALQEENAALKKLIEERDQKEEDVPIEFEEVDSESESLDINLQSVVSAKSPIVKNPMSEVKRQDNELLNLQPNKLRDKRIDKKSFTMLDQTSVGGTQWYFLKNFAKRSNYKQQTWWVSKLNELDILFYLNSKN